MKKRLIVSILSLATLLLANSCAPNTPASRIAKFPAVYESLSSQDKALAKRGQVKKGMHRDGVMIAWGRPDGQSAGSRNGRSFERWTYTTADPVYAHNFYNHPLHGYGGRFGCRGGRFGGRGGRFGYGHGLGVGSQVFFVRRTAATVEFDQNSKVTEWVTRR